MKQIFAVNMLLALVLLWLKLNVVSVAIAQDLSSEISEDRKARLTEQAFEKLRSFQKLSRDKRLSDKPRLILELISFLDIKEEVLEKRYNVGCEPVTLRDVLKKLNGSVMPYYSEKKKTELMNGPVFEVLLKSASSSNSKIKKNKKLFAELLVKLAEDQLGPAYTYYYEYNKDLPNILNEELVDDDLDFTLEIMVYVGNYAPARRFAAVIVAIWICYMESLEKLIQLGIKQS